VGLTRYALQQRGSLNYDDLARGLKALQEIGWVEEILTNPKRYNLNEDNEVVRHLLEFFTKVGYI